MLQLQLIVLSHALALVTSEAAFQGTKCSSRSGWRLKTPLTPVAGTETPLTHSEASTSGQRHPQPGLAPAAAPRSSRCSPSPWHRVLQQPRAWDREWGRAERWLRAGRAHCGDQVQGSAGQATEQPQLTGNRRLLYPCLPTPPLCSSLLPLPCTSPPWMAESH